MPVQFADYAGVMVLCICNGYDGLSHLHLYSMSTKEGKVTLIT